MPFHRPLVIAGAVACSALTLAVTAPPVLGPGPSTGAGDGGAQRSGPPLTTAVPGQPGPRGRYAAGAELALADLPTAPGSQVLSTTLTPAGDRRQVAMVAIVGRGPKAVLRFYRARLHRLGLHEVQSRAVSGSGAAFANATGSVLVTATPGADRTTTYTVFATLITRGA